MLRCFLSLCVLIVLSETVLLLLGLNYKEWISNLSVLKSKKSLELLTANKIYWFL